MKISGALLCAVRIRARRNYYETSSPHARTLRRRCSINISVLATQKLTEQFGCHQSTFVDSSALQRSTGSKNGYRFSATMQRSPTLLKKTIFFDPTVTSNKKWLHFFNITRKRQWLRAARNTFTKCKIE